jgi:hypothetical protein
MSRLLEQLFGHGAVGLGALHMGFDAGDLGFEGFDALLQLLDRQRVEVLLAQRDQRVVRLAREEVVQIHDPKR